MIHKTSKVALILAVCLVTPAISQADAAKFQVRKGNATFVSDAPLETMEGTTSKVTGTVTFDPTDLSTTKGTFKAPVVSMRTGNDLRDEHLQSDSWLDAKKNPHIVFEIVEVSGVEALKPKKSHKVKVKGKFTAHGITKIVDAKGTVKWTPVDGGKDDLRIKANFTAILEDHDVSVPSIVRLKVANEIAVSVDLQATADSASTQSASR
ncbi:MAG: YceI family protein [Myxococcales bacterium]|nr:YceI family protein [Myxococcales bacterium]MDH3485523.1 YceI family protein [Myxococcales bacterium]